MAKGKFKKEKGKVVADILSTHDMRVVIHENTNPEILKMFMDAAKRVMEKNLHDIKE